MARTGILPWLLPFLGLLAACASDSTDPSVPSGTATIVIDLEGDAGEYHVVLQRAGGQPYAHLQPDATGRAEATIRDGDMLTLVHVDDASGDWRLTTVTDLRIGDTVALGDGPVEEDLEHSLLVDLDYPGTATTLNYFVGCTIGGGFSEFPRFFDVRESCLSVDREFNILFTATEPGAGPSYFTYATEIPLESASVDLVGTWRTDWQDFTLDLDPGEPASGSLAVRPVRGGHRVGQLHSGNWTSDGTTPATVDLQLPRGFAEFLSVWIDESSQGQTRFVTERFPVDTASAGRTISGLPPRLLDLEYRDPDAGGPALVWEVEGDDNDADYFEVILAWEDDTASRDVSWRFLLPPTARAVAVPGLPEELAAARLPAGTFPSPWISRVADSNLDGYAEFRTQHVDGGGFLSTQGSATLLRTNGFLPEPEAE